jgi:hypothetical protein
MVRLASGVAVLLVMVTTTPSEAAKKKPAGGTAASCFADTANTTQKKWIGKNGLARSYCCYEDGCWECLEYTAGEADCIWVDAPLVFPAPPKVPDFSRSDTLDPGSGRPPRKQPPVTLNPNGVYVK